MHRKELEALRKPLPPSFPFQIKEHDEVDEYGYYSTGRFQWKGKTILINIEDGKWHLSVTSNHPLGYMETKQIRYMFLLDRICVGELFPPREEFVNIHENCYHLYEI